MSIAISTSPGRAGFGRRLSLSYEPGAGNSAFGFGWSLSLPSIVRKTDKGLPQYLASADSDVFLLSGAEDLVPFLTNEDGGDWAPEQPPAKTVDGKTYRIRRYRPPIKGLFARIERWTNTDGPADVFWRSITKDDVTTWYGRSGDNQVADPANRQHDFSWLTSESKDDKGNVVVCSSKAEVSARVLDDAGNAYAKARERKRTDLLRTSQRCLKYIRYGNRSPLYSELQSDAPWPEPIDAHAPDGSNAWVFETAFDYAEPDADVGGGAR